MWRALGFLDERREVGVVGATLAAYEKVARSRWALSIQEAPHGKRWHTSFHASRFPSHEAASCDRAAMYEMLAVPPPKPASPSLVAISDAGKDIEVQIVTRWYSAGILLSHPPTDPVQLGFEDHEHWLTCSFDAILDLRPDWDAVHPVDVKGKDHSVVEAMIAGNKGPELRHVQQVTAQTYLARMHHERMGWDELGFEKARGASLLYVSRARPMTMQEFYIQYDEDAVNIGLERLERRQQQFVDEELPERDPSWQWMEDPCRWCDFKSYCKKDVRKGVTELEQSAAVAGARKVNPFYEYSLVRQAVLDRWKGGKA
jgi:hypothetical protein